MQRPANASHETADPIRRPVCPAEALMARQLVKGSAGKVEARWPDQSQGFIGYALGGSISSSCSPRLIRSSLGPLDILRARSIVEASAGLWSRPCGPGQTAERGGKDGTFALRAPRWDGFDYCCRRELSGSCGGG